MPDKAAGRTRHEGTLPFTGTADDIAKSEAGDVQQCGGDHETGSIGCAGRILRHFGAVRMAVKDGEEADNAERCRKRRLDIERNNGAEHDDGKRDADFNEGNVDAGNAEGTTERHYQNEGRRHEPCGATAELKCENADHHHGEDMIET